jgi:hypothetical protein
MTVLWDTVSCPCVLTAYKETSMGPDVLLASSIGVAGTVIGVAATFFFSRKKVTQKKTGYSFQDQKTETVPVLGESVDVRELRIFRALFGERKGRFLESFKNRYYGPALEALLEKGWVKQVGKRYCMTPKGGEFCRAYLTELLSDWKPAD